MPARPLLGGLAAAACALAGCGPGGAAPAASPGSVEQGRLLLSQYQCGSCHTIPGVASAQGRVAGSLQSFGDRSYIAGRVANRPELLAQWIARPQSLVPGTAMPDMGVPPEAARHMAAYLLERR
jgi:cytochrome c